MYIAELKSQEKPKIFEIKNVEIKSYEKSTVMRQISQGKGRQPRTRPTHSQNFDL